MCLCMRPYQSKVGGAVPEGERETIDSGHWAALPRRETRDSWAPCAVNKLETPRQKIEPPEAG